jgi:hypothetical protein
MRMRGRRSLLGGGGGVEGKRGVRCDEGIGEGGEEGVFC